MNTYTLRDVSVRKFSGERRNKSQSLEPNLSNNEVETSITFTPQSPHDNSQFFSFLIDIEVKTLDSTLAFTLGVLFESQTPESIPLDESEKRHFISNILYPSIFPYIRQYVQHFSATLHTQPITFPFSPPTEADATFIENNITE
ncbi:hypothetical protein [Arcanobacterium phocae]|uniref:Preprotein translocase subunit SecB n=1 Tax=Arcanobacterium phocae TaxID=131112 RepID=A0A1H2LBT6_9ACTO|nr:hypothetical protein [Arcanobacterium phocae]SDU78195.1 hypothetical protein SAMN04489737_0366 [Arcanobacterium phocae]